MATIKKRPSLPLLLTRYDFSIDFDKPTRLVIEETDILLSAHGRIDNLNYLYLLRPGLTDNDWKVYHVKNKNVGYLPSELYKNSKNVKHIVKRVKSLL